MKGTLALAIIVLGLAVALVERVPLPSLPTPAPGAGMPALPLPLLTTPAPVPAPLEPTRVIERNGRMTVSDVQAMGTLITAVVTATGDIERREGDWRREDVVAYHIDHTVLAGVDMTRAELRVERLADGGQRAIVNLPPSELLYAVPTAQAGVTHQQRRGPALWLAPLPLWLLYPEVGSVAPALVNRATSDAQRLAGRAACDATLVVTTEDGPVAVDGITRAAALTAQGYLRGLLYAAGFTEVAVIAPTGACQP